MQAAENGGMRKASKVLPRQQFTFLFISVLLWGKLAAKQKRNQSQKKRKRFFFTAQAFILGTRTASHVGKRGENIPLFHSLKGK